MDNHTKPVKVSEFKEQMGKNPLGSDPLVKKVGDKFIVEFYPDGIAGEKLQVWRKALENENHFRVWKKVCDFEDFDGEIRDKYRNMSVSDIEERQ